MLVIMAEPGGTMTKSFVEYTGFYSVYHHVAASPQYIIQHFLASKIHIYDGINGTGGYRMMGTGGTQLG